MANRKEMTAAQFGGLPMESLIGGPLKAVCEAQTKQAESTAEFIRKTGAGNAGEKTVGVTFVRNEVDESGDVNERRTRFQVPLLAVVPIPAVTIQEMDVNFDITIKSFSGVTTGRDGMDERKNNSGADVNMSDIKWGPVSISVRDAGQSRQADSTANYRVDIKPESKDMPE